MWVLFHEDIFNGGKENVQSITSFLKLSIQNECEWMRERERECERVLEWRERERVCACVCKRERGFGWESEIRDYCEIVNSKM